MMAYEKLAKYYDLIYFEKSKVIEDCDFLEIVFDRFCKHKPEEIVDIGCGTGSHSIILAERGYKITGIDKSEGMIEEAKRKLTRKGNPVFLVQDMKCLELPAKLDCAICIFNAFGYLTAQKDLQQFFSSLGANLKKGALFTFEFWNVEGVKPTPYKEWTKRQQNDLSLYRLVKSVFHVETNILQSDKELIVVRGKNLIDCFEENHELRCYTIFELRQLLENNHFELLTTIDFDKKNRSKLKTPDRETFRVIAIARLH